MERAISVINAWWKIILVLFFIGMLYTQVQRNEAEIANLKPICEEVIKIDGRVSNLEKNADQEYKNARDFQAEMRQELKEIKALIINLGDK